VLRPRRLLVFTGPIDEYFGYDLGRLTYRYCEMDQAIARSMMLTNKGLNGRLPQQ